MLWMSQKIRVLTRAQTHYCKKAKKTKASDDWEQYKRLRNLVTLEMRRSKLQYFEGVNMEANKNPRKAWKELNRLLGDGKTKRSIFHRRLE